MPLNLDQVRNVAVVRALGGIGDVLCVVPALKRLRYALPQARVTYIGMPQIEGVVARYPHLVDRFVAFPSFPGVPEMPFDGARLTAFLDTNRGSARYDLALQLHGSGSVSNVFTALLEPKRIAGYHLPGLWAPEGSLPFPNHLPEVERWIALVASFGMTDGDAALEWPVSDADRAALPPELEKNYVIVHVGASDVRRRWAPDRFAAIADRLAADGLQVVLTGTPAERVDVDAVKAAMRAEALDLCGRTSLGAAGALIERARLVVTNDTGTSHIAAALGTPSVVIFLISDPRRWAPADRERHRVVGRGVFDPEIGGVPDLSAAVSPSVDEALAAVDALLAVPA